MKQSLKDQSIGLAENLPGTQSLLSEDTPRVISATRRIFLKVAGLAALFKLSCGESENAEATGVWQKIVATTVGSEMNRPAVLKPEEYGQKEYASQEGNFRFSHGPTPARLRTIRLKTYRQNPT